MNLTNQILQKILSFERKHIYRPQRSWGKVIFSKACVNNSVHGGACVVARGGMCGCTGGGAWFYLGDMCGFIWGACMVLFGGMHGFIQGSMHGFIWGACMVLFRGVHGFIWGACVVLFGGCVWFYSGGILGFIWGGMRGFFSFFGYNEIRSMSGRYASYLNAFLFKH